MWFRLWKQVFSGESDNGPIREDIRSVMRNNPENDYRNIHIQGDARVILGNTYGTNIPFMNTTQSQPEAMQSVSTQQQQDAQHQIIVETLDSALPVLVLQEYGQMSSRMELFRHGPIHGSQKWARSIGVWHNILQQSLQDLLEPFQGAEIADKMLSNSKHTMWSSDALKSHLEACFGFHVHTIEITLAAMSSDIRVIDKILIRWQERSVTELQYATNFELEGLMLDRHLPHLFGETNHLRTLVRHSVSRRVTATRANVDARARTVVECYRRIQAAAMNLHSSLVLACSKHVQHRVHLVLDAITSGPVQVCFKLALAQSEAKMMGNRQPLLRLAIESQCEAIAEQIQTGTTEKSFGVPESGARGKRPPGSEVSQGMLSCKNLRGQDKDKTRVQVHGDSETITNALNHDNNGSTRQDRKLKSSVSCVSEDRRQDWPDKSQNSDALPNFCLEGDLCVHLDSVQPQGVAKQDALGYLESQSCTRHLIYLDGGHERAQSAPFPPPRTDPVTLKEFLATEDLMRSTVASISRQLAVAAVQYHTTPWLEVWDNEHVLVSRINSSRDSHSPDKCDFESCVDVLIHKPADIPSEPIMSRSKTLIPNWTLLKLGIMLLELAYQNPLCEMRDPDDFYPSEHDTDFYTARRLSVDVSRKMGTRFARVVERCVTCNFGHGEDLSDTNLQDSYYDNVIRELEEIERGLGKLGL